jgi:hypothetical protein
MEGDTEAIADADLAFLVDTSGAADLGPVARLVFGLTDARADAELRRVTGAVIGRTRDVRKCTGDAGFSTRRRRCWGLYWG